MNLHCFDVALNPNNYELSDSVAAMEGSYCILVAPTTMHGPNTDFEHCKSKRITPSKRS